MYYICIGVMIVNSMKYFVVEHEIFDVNFSSYIVHMTVYSKFWSKGKMNLWFWIPVVPFSLEFLWISLDSVVRILLSCIYLFLHHFYLVLFYFRYASCFVGLACESWFVNYIPWQTNSCLYAGRINLSPNY